MVLLTDLAIGWLLAGTMGVTVEGVVSFLPEEASRACFSGGKRSREQVSVRKRFASLCLHCICFVSFAEASHVARLASRVERELLPGGYVSKLGHYWEQSARIILIHICKEGWG